MYDELVKSLRNCVADENGCCFRCPEDCNGPCQENLMTEAADAIEELATKLATLQDSCKWIPVTERLPDKPEGYPKCEIRRTYYLVALKSGCVKTLGYEFDRDEWQITGSPVVAWMPLPEPPKEE